MVLHIKKSQNKNKKQKKNQHKFDRGAHTIGHFRREIFLFEYPDPNIGVYQSESAYDELYLS